MHRALPHALPRRPQPVTRAAVLSADYGTLADDLSVIARIEQAMRVAAADRPHHPRATAMTRFADWLSALR
jgi:hypothetical protein